MSTSRTALCLRALLSPSRPPSEIWSSFSTLEDLTPEKAVLSARVRAMASSAEGGSRAGDLRGQSCVGLCGKDTPKLSAQEIAQKSEAVPLWVLNDDQTMISRSFVARNFVSALKFFSDVGEIAEAEGHHPDLHLTSYRNVRVDISTHAINGLSLPDFILAAKLDALEVLHVI